MGFKEVAQLKGGPTNFRMMMISNLEGILESLLINPYYRIT